jgi:small subunit ribosomal protein S16
MAVSIRLRREGAKGRPYYRIVVAESSHRRDGRFIELIGTYDPLQTGENYSLKLDRAEYWLSVGAQPSETVGSIIKKVRRKARQEAAVSTPASASTKALAEVSGE